MPQEHKHDVCPPSVAKWLNSPLRTLLESPKRLLKPYTQPGHTVVDLGCGGGIFSVVAAQLVGPKGRVVSVDMQAEMFDILGKLARKRGVADRITTHLCPPDGIGLEDVEADLVLTVHVIHETPDPIAFVTEAASLVKPGGYLLMLEPKGHASPEQINQAIRTAENAGLSPVKPLKNMSSAGMVFQRKV